MTDFSLFTDSSDAVVKDVGVIANSLLIHKSRTEHIAAIAGLRANRAGKNLKHQVGRIDGMAITGLDFLRFWKTSRPDCPNSRLSKNPLRVFLGFGQQGGGDIGIVIQKDCDLCPWHDCCLGLTEPIRRCYQKHCAYERFKYSAHGVTSAVAPTLLVASSYLNGLEITS